MLYYGRRGEVFGFLGHNGAGRDTMLLKILTTANLLLALVTTGCGLAIHYKWVGEMEPTPQIVLGALAVLLALVTTVVALA